MSRLDEMKKLGDPVVQREQELQERPHCFDELGASIVHYEKILQQYAAGVSYIVVRTRVHAVDFDQI